MKKSVIVLAMALVAVAVALFFYLRDTSAPDLAVKPDTGPVSDQRPLVLELKDEGAGLKSVQVTVTQNGKTTELLNRTYEPQTRFKAETLKLAGAGLKDGPLEVRVHAVDHSIYPFGSGNKGEKTFSFTFDSRAPVISVMTTTHNINQGGGGLVLYKLNEDAVRTGVTIGKYFFPGHRIEGDLYASLFAWPWSMPASEFLPRVVAQDAAGNVRQGGFYYHANAKVFPKDSIEISDAFLQNKAPEFEEMVPGVKDPLELFLKVNGEVRAKNVAALMEIGKKTSPRPLWDGPFRRELGATRGFFAQGRTYFYKGQEIDQATHLGVDVAGLAQMPVKAANRGKVVFADYLGIYGNCIVVDHGLGLQSLYAHLSHMNVKEGETVEKGQPIARSGASGMAGGDHLHFGMLIAGLEVVPLEWWDPNWLANNITSKLELVPGRGAQAADAPAAP